MADSGEHPRQDTPLSSRPASGKARQRTQASEPSPDHNSGNKKSNRRSSVFVSIPSDKTARDQSSSHIATPKDAPEKVSSRIATLKDASEQVLVETDTASTEKAGEARDPSKSPANDIGPQARSPLSGPDSPSDAIKPGLANESEGSSGSSETITHVSPVRRDISVRGVTAKPRKPYIAKNNALSFLDTDSPQLTPERIQRTVKEASKASPDTAKNTSPSAHSTLSTSSGPREDLFDIIGDHETDRSTSPERSINGDPRGRAETGPRMTTGKGGRRSYVTPETPRGNVQHPYVPPEDLTPRAPNQHFVKHILRPERPPLTGYELVASRLSATSVCRSGPPLRPIYRRFESLNHRVLLHLQDEICELEEQLRRIDAIDTENRRLQTGILPASRRAESMSNSEFQWQKTDILGRIGGKLEIYNRVLSAFRQSLSLPAPSPADMHEYRSFLSSYAPIAEIETQFLDATDDLVYVGYSDDDAATNEEDVITPISRSDITDFQSRRRVSILSQSDISRRYDERGSPSPDQGVDTQSTAIHDQPTVDKQLLTHLSMATAAAITLPILTFLVIPGFIGRMTVACLVGIGILGALVQGKVIMFQATQQLFVSVGLYGGVMALLAGMIN
ncbi:hypothetical protein GQX73_g9051 [Xylaria multiplex]|uniref:DUF6594 domain-containing protein n=1 Tax=Xylaria multiplex TaxID=323545 RepID=A0A7C8IR86_9PEZI|nr:hypothetical protein GQX73_g9051 [Xylaria multiplex]